MNTFMQLFMLGANELATHTAEYGPEQKSAGFTKEEWDLITQDECWSKSQQLKIESVISSAVSITLRTAGLPPTPLPGAYIAATICKLVAPCNRLIAAASAPESFDVLSATGLLEESRHVITSREQMFALVVYFSASEFGALESFAVDTIAEEQALASQL